MKHEAWSLNSQMTEAHVYKRTSNVKNPKIIKNAPPGPIDFKTMWTINHFINYYFFMVNYLQNIFCL